jgi:hypothetical protein
MAGEIKQEFIHGIQPCQTIMGQPSEWDTRTFGFVNDISGRDIQSIEVVESMFARTRRDISTHVHGTVANVSQVWASNPALELLLFIPNKELGSISSIIRHLMLVPPQCVPIFIHCCVSPKQLWQELGTAVIANNDQQKCKALMNWILVTINACGDYLSPLKV